jgi:hypothetical protein
MFGRWKPGIRLDKIRSLESNPQKHIMFGNILQLQIILKQRKAEPRMLVVFFVKNDSLVTALQEPLHISWRVLSWAKSKQAYKHVLQSTKRMMIGVEH